MSAGYSQMALISSEIEFLFESAVVEWVRNMVGFPGGSVVKNLPASAEMQETQVWSLGLEDPLEEDGNSVQYSFQGDPMDREAWQATVPGFPNNQTWLGNWAQRVRVLCAL